MLVPIVAAVALGLVSASGAVAETGLLDCALWQVADGTPEGHSRHLGCTGLYANFPSRVVAAGVERYAPGYALWSDGAEKRRWIYLPPGTQIDSSDPDGWVFPVGTKVWKEFAFRDRLVETRHLWKRPAGWFEAVYVWSPDGSIALEYTGPIGLPTLGDGVGAPYEIPSPGACRDCHSGSRDMLLGFEAVSLAAEHAEGLTLAELGRRGLLSEPFSEAPIAPGDGDAREALGWLHANCGTTCHNARGRAGGTGLHMRLLSGYLGSIEETATWRTAVGVPSGYQPPADAMNCGPSSGECPPWLRIDRGDPNRSTVLFRAAVRDPYPGPYANQMPPVASHRIPAEASETLARWIMGL